MIADNLRASVLRAQELTRQQQCEAMETKARCEHAGAELLAIRNEAAQLRAAIRQRRLMEIAAEFNEPDLSLAKKTVHRFSG